MAAVQSGLDGRHDWVETRGRCTTERKPAGGDGPPPRYGARGHHRGAVSNGEAGGRRRNAQGEVARRRAVVFDLLVKNW